MLRKCNYPTLFLIRITVFLSFKMVKDKVRYQLFNSCSFNTLGLKGVKCWIRMPSPYRHPDPLFMTNVA